MNILILVVALLHIYFLIVEMFLWNKAYGRKVFRLSEDKAALTKDLAANQGLYNGFLAAGLLWGLWHPQAEFALQIKLFFLICVVLAGVFGAFSVNKKIFFIQALPALIALLTIYI